jgi:hypothetical protein
VSRSINSHLIFVGTRNFSFCRPSRGDTSTILTDDILRIPQRTAARGRLREEAGRTEAERRKGDEGREGQRGGGGRREEKTLLSCVEKGMAEMVQRREASAKQRVGAAMLGQRCSGVGWLVFIHGAVRHSSLLRIPHKIVWTGSGPGMQQTHFRPFPAGASHQAASLTLNTQVI